MLKHDEFYAQVVYYIPNECSFYAEIKNGFRSAFWSVYGISTAIMFVDIPGNSLLPGEEKTVLCYSINSEFAVEFISSNKALWGPATCAIGSIFM